MMKKFLALLAAVPLFLSVSSPALAQVNNLTMGIPPSNYIKITSLPKLLSAIIGVILIVAFIIALFFLFWGGIQWISSGGDKEGVEAAQKKIQAAIVGLIVVASVYALFTLVGNWLGFDITNLVLPDPKGN